MMSRWQVKVEQSETGALWALISGLHPLSFCASFSAAVVLQLLKGLFYSQYSLRSTDHCVMQNDICCLLLTSPAQAVELLARRPKQLVLVIVQAFRLRGTAERQLFAALLGSRLPGHGFMT